MLVPENKPNGRETRHYFKLVAISRIRWAVRSSAGKKVSSASSDSVTSTACRTPWWWRRSLSTLASGAAA